MPVAHTSEQRLLAVEHCGHTGSQMCARCCWQRPPQAVLLVLRGRTVRKAVPVAAVVGTVLSLVNQGSVLLSGSATWGTWFRVAVNYLVPFIVAGIGYLSGRRLRPAAPDWPGYLATFHDELPGITERVLSRAEHDTVPPPYVWLAAPLLENNGPILDLACGSAPTRPLLGHGRWLGVDSALGELDLARQAGRGPVACADVAALPVRAGSVAAVCGAMCFPLFDGLDAVLAELRRALRPGGQLVALVPSARVGPRRGLSGWFTVLRALGLRSLLWPEPRAQDRLAKVLRGHGFVVDSDERRVFRRPVSGRDDAELLVDSLYLPTVEESRVRDAKQALANWAGDGRSLPLPLRRVVAHLPNDREAR